MFSHYARRLLCLSPYRAFVSLAKPLLYSSFAWYCSFLIGVGRSVQVFWLFFFPLADLLGFFPMRPILLGLRVYFFSLHFFLSFLPSLLFAPASHTASEIAHCHKPPTAVSFPSCSLIIDYHSVRCLVHLSLVFVSFSIPLFIFFHTLHFSYPSVERSSREVGNPYLFFLQYRV
ncbi:hypothetical protein B9Z19DRAFT_32392 [Tuber borchii]|uniref:Uncharacterized protein n=1 Tax=Tuber borchii TaxID=42251 RepID=A0A2T6ZTL4_TUBBO|nr:hypothetical protein B9Z19DRAFT_32392 [Tuber borchii]